MGVAVATRRRHVRDISCEEITSAVERLCIQAATVLPPALGILLECASETESSPAGAAALNDIVENFKFAADSSLPICQDTGMTVVFADVGQEVRVTGGAFEDAVNEGVRRGYKGGGLRMSVVSDPFRRVNTGDNSPAVIHTRLVPGDTISLDVAPKGFGSENMSAARMFLPNDGADDVIGFITDTARSAGANPCPPTVLGVGLGGTFDMAALLAKRALMRPADKRNADPFYADMERLALAGVNSLGIGPQGFGGHYTCLAVNIETFPTHIAGLPCVVNVGCHATRHAHRII
jgi:fumarate hydratase subunit alpha